MPGTFSACKCSKYGNKTDTRDDGRQAAKGQPCKDMVPGFERMDHAGHGGCIPTGDRLGKMAGINSHSRADIVT